VSLFMFMTFNAAFERRRHETSGNSTSFPASARKACYACFVFAET
jgi:hypothetical protein